MESGTVSPASVPVSVPALFPTSTCLANAAIGNAIINKTRKISRRINLPPVRRGQIHLKFAAPTSVRVGSVLWLASAVNTVHSA